MNPCVHIHIERDKTICTCQMYVTTKFVIIDELHVRLHHDARWLDKGL